MGTDTLQGETEAHITTGQWQRMERLIAEVHDALLGTMDRPGGLLVRVEKIEQRLSALEAGDRDRSAGWRQAGWIVVSVILSTVTTYVISVVGVRPH